MTNTTTNTTPTTNNNTNTNADTNTNSRTSGSAARRGSRVRGILLAAFVALLAASAIVSRRIVGELPGEGFAPFANPPAAARPSSSYSADIRRYNKAVADALERHIARLRQITDSFKAGLREKGPARFGEARAAIPGIRRKFSGFMEVSGVVKDGVLDKVLGGERLQNRFNAALDGPFIQPCARAGESLVSDYETFAARMAAEDEAFRNEIVEAHGSLPEAVRVGFPADTLRGRMASTYGALNRMPLKAGLVAAETAIEIATIRSTAKAVERLALRFGAKAIGKGAAAAVAPAADGPSPILDIVAVVCAAWTVKDICELKGVLPREIEKSLVATVDAVQSQTMDLVLRAAEETYAAHAAAAAELAKSATAK